VLGNQGLANELFSTPTCEEIPLVNLERVVVVKEPLDDRTELLFEYFYRFRCDSRMLHTYKNEPPCTLLIHSRYNSVNGSFVRDQMHYGPLEQDRCNICFERFSPPVEMLFRLSRSMLSLSKRKVNPTLS
jgi:hypothetical protein